MVLELTPLEDEPLHAAAALRAEAAEAARRAAGDGAAGAAAGPAARMPSGAAGGGGIGGGRGAGAAGRGRKRSRSRGAEAAGPEGSGQPRCGMAGAGEAGRKQAQRHGPAAEIAAGPATAAEAQQGTGEGDVEEVLEVQVVGVREAGGAGATGEVAPQRGTPAEAAASGGGIGLGAGGGELAADEGGAGHRGPAHVQLLHAAPSGEEASITGGPGCRQVRLSTVRCGREGWGRAARAGGAAGAG